MNEITYADIEKANEGLKGIDVKGKAYIMVPERVKAFRKLFPQGFIKTDIVSLENGVVYMKARAGYYGVNGDEVVLGTGLAYEKESNGYINKTSFIENCETSAVGRCLGFLALGVDGGGICSAEELANAITNQNNAQNGNQSNAQVVVVSKVPSRIDSRFDYRPIFSRIKTKLGLTDREFAALRKSLIANGVVEDVPGAELDEDGWTKLEMEMMKAKGVENGVPGQIK